MDDSKHRVRQKRRQPPPNTRSPRQDRNKPFRMRVTRKELPEGQTLRSLAPSVLRISQKRSKWSRREMSPSSIFSKDDRQPSPKRAPQGDNVKGPSAIAQHTQVETLCRSLKIAWGNLKLQGTKRTKHKGNWSDCDREIACCQVANRSRSVRHKRGWHERLLASPDFPE